MSRDFKIALAVLALLTAGVILWLPYSPAGRQRANMALAEAHLPQIRERIQGDPRFNEVTLYVYTGLDGAVGVHGTVRSEEALVDLRRMVESTNPPRPVFWTVKVYPEE